MTTTNTRSEMEFVTVPREPTEAMASAGAFAFGASAGSNEDAAENTYRAMLAAAPTAPTLIEAATAEQGICGGAVEAVAKAIRDAGHIFADDRNYERIARVAVRAAKNADCPASPEQGAVHGYHANRIVEILKEYPGFWRSCSGCQESSDGAVSTKDYPYDAVFKCRPGSGCSECGGLGVIWDDIDYSAWSDEFPVPPVAAEAEIKQGAVGREEIEEVRHVAGILENWEMRPTPNKFTGHSYEDIAKEIIAALRPSASAGGEYQRGIEDAARYHDAAAAENRKYFSDYDNLFRDSTFRHEGYATAIRALTPSPVVAEVERLRGLLNQALAACNYAAKFPKLAAEIRAALSVVPEVAK